MRTSRIKAREPYIEPIPVPSPDNMSISPVRREALIVTKIEIRFFLPPPYIASTIKIIINPAVINPAATIFASGE